MWPVGRGGKTFVAGLALVATALLLSGCGSGRARASICLPRAQQLVARTLGIRPSAVTAVRSTGSNVMPQCSFTARAPGQRRLSVTVNVDTSPQPYMVLARTIEERAQGFTPTSVLAAPVAVMGLGLEASWFPDESTLMSTDGVRLIRTTVRWGGAKQSAKVGLATRVSRLYLGRSKPSLAKRSP
jgi:hypothetical protein